MEVISINSLPYMSPVHPALGWSWSANSVFQAAYSSILKHKKGIVYNFTVLYYILPLKTSKRI